MKKILSALLVLILLTSASLGMAEVDLTGLSYDELVALKAQVDLAIWESEEWQEVTVPQGVYEVGVDIPVGHWTILPADGGYSYVTCGDMLDNTKKDISWEGDYYVSQSLTSPNYSYYSESQDVTQVDFELEDGMYVVIDSGSVIFTPYAGKASLGFK